MSEISSSIEEGNMVDLPHDVLEQLNENDLSPPYFFQLSTQSNHGFFVLHDCYNAFSISNG